MVDLNFGQALEAIKNGKRVAREGWNGKNMWLRLFKPFYDKEFEVIELYPLDIDSGTLLPWIGIRTAQNGFVPWLASQQDMLEEDWFVILDK